MYKKKEWNGTKNENRRIERKKEMGGWKEERKWEIKIRNKTNHTDLWALSF